MFKRCFFPTFIAILAIVACTKDVQDPGLQPTRPAGYGSVHSLSVGIESGAYVPEDVATKASMEAVIRVKWEKNDEVSVINATKGTILGGCLKANDSGTSVIFSGEVVGTIEEGNVLYYVYPRIAQNPGEIGFDQTNCNVSLANQTYDGLNSNKVCFFGFAKDQATSTSTNISKHIKFTLVTSYAHLNMANLPAAGFNLSSIDISNVNKGFKWSLSNATLTADAYGENEGISVNCSNCKITQAGNAVVRFAIPASAATGARVITVNKAYTNDKYVTDQLKPSAYYNQLYTSWESNVKVTSQGDKTKVDITTSEGSTDVAEGVIPVAEAFNDTKPTEIGIGGVGTVTFDATATATIKSNADAEGSTNVFFKVEDVTETKPVQDANLVYEVTMKTVDEKGVEVFKEGKAAGVATVTVPLGEEVVSVESVSLVDENGQKISGGVVDNSWQIENGILTFQVNHFSKYAISYTKRTQPITAVAQIGNSKYTTLARAIDAVQNGNTIKLLCDCMDAEGIIVPEGKNFTLDFGGHTYKVTKDLAGSTGTKNQCFQLLKGSTLVFQNGTITTSCAKTGINTYSTLTLNNINIDMTGSESAVVCLMMTEGDIKVQGNTNLIAKDGKYAAISNYWPASYGDIDVVFNTTGEIKGIIGYGSNGVQDKTIVKDHSHFKIIGGKYNVSYDMEGIENPDFKIYGGVFKTSPDGKYLAPNHMVVSNTDSETSGTYPHTVQQKPYVAQIGDTKYYTLADAVAAVPANTQTTITMVNDFATTEKVTIAAAQNIVLDLNGKEISYTADACGSFIENKGQLTVKDSGSNGMITAKFNNPNWSAGCYTINNAGTYENASKLVIESGTIENTSPAGLAWPISNGVWGTYADLVINGGTIHSTNYVPVREYLQYGGKKTIVINGGKFISDNSRAIAVQVNDATIEDTGSSVTINGGEFTCKGSGILYVDMHAANTDLTGFTMTVNDGQFKNADADAPVLVYDYEGKDHDSAVLLSKILKGGIYSKEPAQELISFGYHIEANTDSQTSSAYPWRVVANSAEGAEVSVSKQGETTVYSTLAAFRDETNAGNSFAGYTVKLLKDVAYSSSNYWTPIGCMNADVYFAGIFDGNGHKVEGLNIETEKLGGSPDYWPGGFFGYTRGAKIKNLSIYGKTDCAGMVGYAEYTDISDCESHMDSELCYNISGGFIAHADAYVTLSNCKNYGNFICKTPANYAEVGGIVGRFYGGDHCSVTNCENYGDISWEGENGGGAQRSLGGIVAGFYNASAISNPQKCVISGCKNFGTIFNKNATSGTTTSTSGGIGGIVGKPFLQANGIGVIISDCTNSGSVVSSGRAGGIVGTLNEAWQNVGKYSTVSGCTNTGTIYGTDGSRGQIYGIMGTNISDPDKDNILSNNQENGILKTYDEYTN